ncbi:hypothetical protein jhhlp_006059 [Lomentospora prolificans]|uniref:Uncharacterized protein n=1 Tax=Lomentospora prolificans TaxID=41688 RepID=A0A2N3N4V5_9PEZI|nr:hypothetical protein jhhlp_006059 [Lomentospora prolificans]
MTTCKACDEPLLLSVVDSDDEGNSSAAGASVPDDLHLPCDCHFHWQCLLDRATDVVSSLRCPACGSALAQAAGSSSSSARQPPILTTYISEGGVEENLDILPIITEEAYVEANPEARPARALHIMAKEGDVEGAVELLHTVSEDEAGNAEEALGRLIRYQDPLASMKSALHLAVEAGQVESVWLLLWLSSSLPEPAFPDTTRAQAQAIGLGRLSVSSPAQDLRSLRDANGHTSEALARESPMLFPLVQAGVLAP